ncbi:PilW family protein [Pseudomonas sp. NCCP-436]|uniref:PilW family protein n=1 Tax=Pseudomonas sp. NCCP-436 TaxID=2842481 RepID=UPI001C820633|nr:prepilin-type N-terminal cleavage/methylation domain-containing protein [Pseudomonas sp. NCCP-436]GIZ11459.1 type 4 fimbrial biogenesis protein PilW [Pseudomonas sp. NCCP-436]
MHKQHGISIIEMMVALLISSFLILGITQVYLDNRQNTLFQQSQGSNIENTRYSILILEQTLAKTGYRRRPDDSMESAFPQISTPCAMEAGQTAKKLSATSFCVRYQPAFPSTRSCDGNIPDAANASKSPYQPREAFVEVFDLQTGELRCNGQTIASGITAINFLYGYNQNEEKEIRQYNDEPGTGNIRAVQFSIMAASDAEVGKTAGSVVYKHWFGEEPDDKRLYTMLSSSTSMRNLMP